jgi:hypothetical protein
MHWEGSGMKGSSLSPSINVEDLRKTTKHFVRIVSVLVDIRARHLPDVSEMCQLAWLQKSNLDYIWMIGRAALCIHTVYLGDFICSALTPFSRH